MRDYGDREWITFDGIYSDNPEKRAICFNWDGTPLWIPRSLLEPEHENMVEKDDGSVVVYIPTFFSEQEGLV